jgi:hypothetical protein
MIVNDCDLLLQQPGPRAGSAGSGLILGGSSPIVRTAADGSAPNPTSIALAVTLLGVSGTPVWSIVGGTLTGTDSLTRTLAVSSMTGDLATITVALAFAGIAYSAKYTVAKVRDGSAGGKGDQGLPGDAGAPAPLYATAYLYQWSTAQPALPNASSTFGWPTAANTAYAGSDGWAIAAPANSGTPGLKLWIVSKPISAAAGTSQSTVTYSTGASISAFTQNGANGANGTNGTNGANGIQSVAATVYQWAATIPAGPAGSPTWSWSSKSFGAAPANWSLTPGTSPSVGMTLWAASVQVVDSAVATSTPFNWSSAAIMAIGYAGTNGSNGSNGSNGAAGAQGASYVTAYCATTVGTGTSAPAPTTGRTSLPAANSGGLTGTYSASVPTLTAGQYQMQTDGIYDPVTNQVVWSIPYQSSLKVGVISAISANLGNITGGNINLGGGTFTVDNNGNLVCTSITIKRADGTVILTTDGLTAAGAAPGTKNSDLAPVIQQAVVTTFAPYQTWEFNVDYGGWYGANGATLTLGAGTVTLTPGNNNDPMLDHDFPGFSGKTYDKIRMRVKRKQGASWDGNLYFNQEGASGSGWVADSTVLNQWVILEWDMSSNAGWVAQSIAHIRIDLGNNSGDIFEIDWIAIGRYGVGSDELAAAAAAAATTATWPNVQGPGRPADYATAGPADAATALGFNPQFSDWAGTYPDQWQGWSGPAPVKDPTTFRTPPYGVRWTVSGDTGMQHSSNTFAVPLVAGSYIDGSYDINIIANNGGLGGPGILIRLFTNPQLTDFDDTLVPVPDKTVTGWQRVPFKACTTSSSRVIYAIQIYQMAAWAGMAGGAWANGSICVFDSLAFDIVKPAATLQQIGKQIGTFTSPGTARTEISDYGIRIYDGSNGALRIKIGQL